MRQYLSLLKSLSLARPPKFFPLFAPESPASGVSLENSLTLHKITRLGSDMVAIVDRTGKVKDCSFSHQDFHGLNRQVLLENDFMEYVHIADRPACLRAFSQAVHSSKQVLVELRLRRHPNADSSEYFSWIELNCSAVDDPDEALEGEGQVLCLIRDISHWKEREAELVAREEAMREKIETRTRLLVNMSHELRTPLNTIIGFSEMMKLPGVTAQNEQQMVEYAGIIFDSGQDLLGVVNEVLDMSQFDAGQYKLDPQIFTVSDLVSAGVELVQLEASEKDVRFAITGHEDNLQMNADWAACKQALVGVLAAQINGASGGQVHLVVNAHKGYVKFVVTALRQTVQQERLDFIIGQQMKKFIDLVSGELNVTLKSPDQNEVVLMLPQNLCANKKKSNIVPIGPELEKPSVKYRKTA